MKNSVKPSTKPNTKPNMMRNAKLNMKLSMIPSTKQISLLVPLNLFKYLLFSTFLCLNKSKISQKSQIGLAEMSLIAKSGNWWWLMICFDFDKTELPDMAIMGIPTCPI